MALTKETEAKIKKLGLTLKLQLDFAAAADMTKREDQLKLAQNNLKAAQLILDLVQGFGIQATNDADIMDDIVAVAEKNGSKAGDVLKSVLPKIRATNDEVREAVTQKKSFQPSDLNAIFRKHLGGP